MKFIDFWFDPISPYAYLAFERMPEVFEGLTYSVTYRPVLFGALLKHWSHKRPAEIEPKRAWTYRQVLWIAHRHGIEMQMPAQHPFNPLALLRLLQACASPPTGTPNRHACRSVLHHVWQGCGDANDAERLAALTTQLAPRLDPSADEVKQALRDATAQAIEAGLFGVPTLVVDGLSFWGLDALEMVAAYLRGDPWFAAGGGWHQAGSPRPGVQRTG
jgi:2-hydroxychromene-2-carboxylate isomerase